MPSQRVIILEKVSDSPLIFRYAMWADVPATRQLFYAKLAGTVSAWNAATAADNLAIVNGEVEERLDFIQVIPGTGIAAIQTQLQTSWQAFQDEITTINKWNRYGTTWNGTAWTAGGVS